MSDSPRFQNPPIVEFVLGVQFSPLTKLTTGHFGLLWKVLGDDWTIPEDAPAIEDQFERFERPKWSHRPSVQLRMEKTMPVGRFVLKNTREDRLVQVQQTRFHLNWRKTGELKPGYSTLITEFETTLKKFQDFTSSTGLGDLEFNQWEITYVDSYPQKDYWETPADWSKILPGLFGTLSAADGLILEHRAAQWSFEIQPKRGRLHIAAHPGRWGDDEGVSLLVNTTARGPIGKSGNASLREGLDLGHEVAVQSFLKTASPEATQRWEGKA